MLQNAMQHNLCHGLSMKNDPSKQINHKTNDQQIIHSNFWIFYKILLIGSITIVSFHSSLYPTVIIHEWKTRHFVKYQTNNNNLELGMGNGSLIFIPATKRYVPFVSPNRIRFFCVPRIALNIHEKKKKKTIGH